LLDLEQLQLQLEQQLQLQQQLQFQLELQLQLQQLQFEQLQHELQQLVLLLLRLIAAFIRGGRFSRDAGSITAVILNLFPGSRSPPARRNDPGC